MTIKKNFTTTLQEMKKKRISYVFILPSVLMFLLFVLYPLVKSVLMSFQKVNLVSSSWIGLENYIDIFTDPIFWIALKNTALFVVILVPVTIFYRFSGFSDYPSFEKRISVLFKGGFLSPRSYFGSHDQLDLVVDIQPFIRVVELCDRVGWFCTGGVAGIKEHYLLSDVCSLLL